MTTPLWTIDEIRLATGGQVEGPANAVVTGISIDTRTLAPGDLFVPLSDKRDGHEFVEHAFQAGAAAALVANDFAYQNDDVTLIRVDDPLCALERLARAARTRLASSAVVIGVTGSVGKTGTKDMLRAAFSALGPTHAANKSYNNHWGVPLTLAQTPRDVQAAVYEIGMNHPGEITPLTKMVRPDIAIITTVEAVHLEFFDSVEQIAEAKAEIFHGLDANGVAVLNADNRHSELLCARAREHGADVKTFGKATNADIQLLSITHEACGTQVSARAVDETITYTLAVPGAHVAQNSLAVVAALRLSGRDVHQAMKALAALTPGVGRGAREQLSVPGGEMLLIDESYNANPASMRAALDVLGSVARVDYPRRVAVLGDMLELGEDSDTLHAALASAIADNDIDLVFASGPHMAALFAELPEGKKGAWAVTVDDIVPDVLAALRAGDAAVIKGSLGSRMAHVLAAIRKQFAC